MSTTSPLSEVSAASLNSRASKSRRNSSAAKSPLKSGRKSPSRRETADPSDMAHLLSEITAEDQAQANKSPKRRTPAANRRETADAGDLAAMLQDLENEDSNVTASAVASPALSLAPSASKSTGKGKAGRQSTGGRRQTADAADLADMLRSLEEDSALAPSVPASAAPSAVASPASRRKSAGNRRQTADAADLAAMLNDLEADNSVASAANSSTASAPAPASGAASPCDMSMSTFSAPSADKSTASDGSNAGGDNKRLTADTQQLADMLKEMQEMAADEGDREDDQSCLLLQEVITAPESVQKTAANVLDISSHPNRFGVLYEDSVCSSRRTSVAGSELDDAGVSMDLSSSGAAQGGDERRQTADAADLEDLLQGMQQEDVTEDLTASSNVSHSVSGNAIRSAIAKKVTMQAPVTTSKTLPSDSAAPVPLRSCLSTSKKPRKQRFSIGGTATTANRSVVFGSPDVAEFNKTSPVTSYTPLARSVGKQMFPIPVDCPSGEAPVAQEEEDEETTENSRILEDWDRLTNASSHGSSEDDEEEDMEAAEFALYNGANDDEERTVELEANLGDIIAESPAAPASGRKSSASSAPSTGRSSRRSSISSRRSSIASSAAASPLVDPEESMTVELEGNLAELVEKQPAAAAAVTAATPASSAPSPLSPRRSLRRSMAADAESAEKTVELECNLLSLVGAEKSGVKSTKKSPKKSPKSGKKSPAAAMEAEEEEHTVALEANLLDIMASDSKPSGSGCGSPKGRASTSSDASSISRSNPKLARRRKSMLQPTALDAEEEEAVARQQEQQQDGAEEDEGGGLSLLVDPAAATVTGVNYSSIDHNKSSATLLSELREGDDEESAEMSMGILSSCNTTAINRTAASVDASTTSGKSDQMATDLSQYGAAAPSNTSDNASFEVEVDDEVSFRRRSRSSSSRSNKSTPSTSTLSAATEEELAATVPRSPAGSRRSSRRSSRASSAELSNASALTMTPAALDDISLISAPVRSADNSVIGAPTTEPVSAPPTGESRRSVVSEAVQQDVVVTEKVDFRMEQEAEEVQLAVSGNSSVIGASEAEEAKPRIGDASGYFYAREEEEGANTCNGSVIAPLVSTFNTNGNRLSIMPSGVRSPLNQATQSTVDGATGKINHLLKKVQTLNSTARRNSLAQLDGSTSAAAGRSSTARFSIAGGGLEGAASRASLKRPRHSMFPSSSSRSRMSFAASSAAAASAAATAVESVAEECAATAAAVAQTVVAAEAAVAGIGAAAKVVEEVEERNVRQRCEPAASSPVVALPTPAASAAPSPLPAAAAPIVVTAPLPTAPAAPAEVVQAVVNNLSYCHVTKLTATRINVTVVLSTYTHAYIAFHLEKLSSSSSSSSGGPPALGISNIEVELVNLYDDESSGSSGAVADVDRENRLAYSFFATVMCNSKFNGPLSEKFLSSHLATAADIPNALHTITGYVVTFRQLLSSLNSYALLPAQQWDVTDVEDGSSAVIVLNGGAGGSNSTGRSIPLPVVLSHQCDLEAAVRSL